MSKILGLAKQATARFRSDESGQDALEYLLVIGLVMVALVGAVYSGLVPATIETFVGDVIEVVTDALTPA